MKGFKEEEYEAESSEPSISDEDLKTESTETDRLPLLPSSHGNWNRVEFESEGSGKGMSGMRD
jgi:hypothetical protein